MVDVSGTVRSEADGIPLPSALVTLTIGAGGTDPHPHVAVQADPYGRFQICGIAASSEVTVQAVYSGRRGVERSVRLDRSRTLSLVVPVGKAAFIVVSVVDADDERPIQGARVYLIPLPDGRVTDPLGRASFRGVPPGTYTMRVEHIAYADLETPVAVATDDAIELRVRLVSRAITIEPLIVEVTGRDPYLLSMGFYDRREMKAPSFFGTAADIAPYRQLNTLFEFNTELSVRFHRDQVLIVNGRVAKGRNGMTMADLGEVSLERIRGVEAYACADAPHEIMKLIPMEMGLTACNVIVIWLR